MTKFGNEFHFCPLKEVPLVYRVYGAIWVPIYAYIFSDVIILDSGEYQNIVLPILSCFCHASLFLLSQWSTLGDRYMNMRKASSIESATHLFCTWSSDTTTQRVASMILPLKADKRGNLFIDAQFERLYYSKELGKFSKPTSFDREPMQAYLSCKGLKSSEVECMSPFQWDIPVPKFLELLKEHLLDPFFVFQLFCVFLWLLDEYWNYALMTLGMLVLLESQVVLRRIHDMTDLRAVKPPVVSMRVLRDGMWVDKLDSSQIFAGDVVELLPGSSIPCDMVVVQGSGLVNESMLTGESVPVPKEPGDESDDRQLDCEGIHRCSCLFGGSELLVTGGSSVMTKKSNTGALRCVVIRTGFDTSQGELIREMLFASDRITAASRESYLFLLVLLIVAVVAAGYVLINGWSQYDNEFSVEGSTTVPRSRFKLLLAVSHILTSVVPPEFPITMSLTVTLALLHLSRFGIYCTAPFRIPFAGKVKTCCFDKTGTLTSADMKLDEIFVKPGARSAEDLCTAHLILSQCHTVNVHENKLVGDPIEIASLEHCLTASVETLARNKIMKKVFHFDPSIQRMAVIVDSLHVLVKGSPERVFACLSVPPADELLIACERFTKNGFRVLALAHKVSKVPIVTRTDAESELELVGIAAYSFVIAPQTVKVIQSLKSAGIRVVMVTGDHPDTAIYVAKAVGIIDQNAVVKEVHQLDEKATSASSPQCAYYITGDPREAILSPGLLKNVAVFARCNPNDKKLIVESLSKDGTEYCLFCGDGTNDVAALKQAHVGIALSLDDQRSVRAKTAAGNMQHPPALSPLPHSHASIAAPFVYKQASIKCVPILIRSGRAALALVMQMYKMLAVNSLVTAFCLSVLTLNGVKLGDRQVAIESIYFSILSFLVSRVGPAKVLADGKNSGNQSNVPYRPVDSVFHPAVLLTIFGQALIHLFLLNEGQASVHDDRIRKPSLEDKFQPSLTNTFAFLQLAAAHISSCIANYAGLPCLPKFTRNKGIVWMVVVGLFTLIVLASDILPVEFNLDVFELVPLGDHRNKLLILLAGHMVGGWTWAMLCRAIERGVW